MTHVTIVGAGLVGCLLSAYLAQAGHEVTIFEQAPDPREVTPISNRSISITVAVRGFRALDKVGIGDIVRQNYSNLRPYDSSPGWATNLSTLQYQQGGQLCDASPGFTLNIAEFFPAAQRRALHV